MFASSTQMLIAKCEIISTVGVRLLFGGIIGLIDYIVFLDENPDYNQIVTLYLVGGGLIIGFHELNALSG